MLTVWIVGRRKKTLIHDGVNEADEGNSKTFGAKRNLSAYRPTDAISNHKRVDPLHKINVRSSSELNIAKQTSVLI